MDKQFPILMNERERKAHPACPSSVPWALVQPHEAQARRTHDQSLQRLADRGGLDPVELLCVLENRGWSKIVSLADSIAKINQLVAES